ncbi:putative beta galactofuranosyl glycosyltransferase [Trypanosoma cruzi]|nr:putative beta galactofuranosyl glycosyltransferase [Trypanosoma cruzi]
MTIAWEGVFFFVQIHTEPSLGTFSFLLLLFSFRRCSLGFASNGICAELHAHFKNRSHEPFLERMLYLSSNIKFVVHVDAFFLEWSSYFVTIPRMVLVLVRPGRNISAASGKGFWWIQRHGGWGEIITGRTLSR